MLWRVFMIRAFFFSISLLLSNSFFAEGKSFSCDPKKYLPEDLANKVLVHRESAFNICLSCEGETCKFKQELLGNSDTFSICKRLFCTASFASRGFEIPAGTPRGKSSFSYQYSISKLGAIKDITITSTDGVFSNKDAKEFVKALTRKTKFLPIKYQGNSYELINLASDMNINTRLGND